MDDQTLGPIEVFEVKETKPQPEPAHPVQSIDFRKSSTGKYFQHPIMMSMAVREKGQAHHKRVFQVKAELAAISFSESYEDQTLSEDENSSDSLRLLMMLEGVRNSQTDNNVLSITVSENQAVVRHVEIPVNFPD